MKLFTHYTDIEAADQGAVIALGNFDGIHRGHQAVINVARDVAADLNAPLGLAMFSPHPTRYFKPDVPPFLLMGRQVRTNVLQAMHVSIVYEIPFDDDLRSMDDTDFVNRVLHRGLGIRHVVVGEDFGFGKNRCGDVDSLTGLCGEQGIGVSSVSPVGLHEFYGKYGSTEIRDALRAGNVFHAAHMLSRPWTIDGIVSHGEQRGRTIGFPTANIPYGDYLRPKDGVYCVEVRIDGEDHWHPGVANSGSRPTVGGTETRLETHIFDFDRDIYGQRVEVRFRSFTRPEQKFESFDALKVQIERDAQGARAVFGL